MRLCPKHLASHLNQRITREGAEKELRAADHRDERGMEYCQFGEALLVPWLNPDP